MMRDCRSSARRRRLSRPRPRRFPGTAPVVSVTARIERFPKKPLSMKSDIGNPQKIFCSTGQQAFQVRGLQSYTSAS
jgi:hypothetical protein